MRGRRSLAAPLLALACLLTACRGNAPMPQPTPTPEVTETAPVLPAEPIELKLPWYSGESVHPLTATNRANLILLPLMYEGLFELDQAFVPQGVLCTGTTVSEDGLSWNFTLRSGVTFSDGSPLTGQDVVSSLQAAMGPESLYRARLTNIAAIRTEGDGTVHITLRTPNGNLPALLDIPIVKETGALPLGTGAYVMDQDGGLLRRNTNWWKGSPLPVDEIKLYPVRATDALIQAFDTRAVSLAAADLTGANALGFSGNYEVWDYSTSTMLYVGYHTASGPCADGAVRRALSLGIDRATVKRSLLSGHAEVAALPFHPQGKNYDATLAGELDYSPQAMDEGLTAAGWTLSDGLRYKGREALTLTFIVNTDNSYKIAVAEHIANSLTQAGAVVELKKLTWEEYNAALAAGEFDLYLGQVRLTGDFDLSPLLTAGGALNYGGYVDLEMDGLLAEYLAANDITRPAAASNLSRRLSEESPLAVVCFKNWSMLTHWGKLTGLSPTQQNLFYGIEGWKLS